MSAKAHSKRAGNPVQVAPEATSRARRGGERPHASEGQRRHPKCTADDARRDAQA